MSLFEDCREKDEFQNLGAIYNGKFANVYKCRDKKNGEVYALKKFTFPDLLKNEFLGQGFREIGILKIIRHPNIINSHGIVAGNTLESTCLLLDYCVISLEELIIKKCDGIFESDVIKHMMKQLFHGIRYLHEKQIVHRNISCRNLLFTECGTLKISGFRTARILYKRNMSPDVTELTYRAPELFMNVSYGFPVDIWSAGCVFAYLLLRKHLFSGNSELEVLKSIISVLGTPSETIWPGFHKNLLKGNIDEKVLSVSERNLNLQKIETGIPELSRLLLNKLIVFYPPSRLKASDVLKNSYFKEGLAECSPEKMKSIVEDSFIYYKGGSLRKWKIF